MKFNKLYEELLSEGLGINHDLYVAAEKGDVKEVKDLMKQGADLHYDDHLPFRSAVRKGHLDVVKLLDKHGHNIIDKKYMGQRPIDIAIENGHIDVIKFLKSKGAKIDMETAESAALFLKKRSGKSAYNKLMKYLNSI